MFFLICKFCNMHRILDNIRVFHLLNNKKKKNWLKNVTLSFTSEILDRTSTDPYFNCAEICWYRLFRGSST